MHDVPAKSIFNLIFFDTDSQQTKVEKLSAHATMFDASRSAWRIVRLCVVQNCIGMNRRLGLTTTYTVSVGNAAEHSHIARAIVHVTESDFVTDAGVLVACVACWDPARPARKVHVPPGLH